MDPKRITGKLMIAAGVLFFVAGLLLRFQQPVWLVLGAALVVYGRTLLPRGPRE